MEGDHFLLPILVRERDHNLLAGTVFGSNFGPGGLILAATFDLGGLDMHCIQEEIIMN